MRPTTKDLAKAAGVSLATVDRVLNGRSGVQEKTVKAVNEAIEKIGFVRNLLAANLARSRTYRFQFLLPRSGDQFLGALIARVDEALAAFIVESTAIQHRQVIGTDPHEIAKTLTALDAATIDGVAIMAPESPQVRDATSRLIERGIQVVQFISGQSATPSADASSHHPVDFVGIDNAAAGATAGRLIGRFSSGKTGKILVLSETMQSRDSLERRLGFDRVLTRDYPELSGLPSLETYGDPERSLRIIQNSYASHPDIVGVYVLSSEARIPLENLAAVSDVHNQTIIAHERTPFTDAMLMSGALDAVIAQDPGHLVRSAIRVLRARCDGREPLASQEQIRIEILLKENLGSPGT